MKTLNERREMVALVALAVLFLLSACAETERADSVLFSKGLEAVQALAADCDGYVTPEIDKLLKQAGAGEYSKPTGLYKLTLNSLEIKGETISEEQQGDALVAVLLMLDSRGGVMTSAAHTQAIESGSFAVPGNMTHLAYLYVFSEGTPACVVFSPESDGMAKYRTRFLFRTDLELSSVDAVEQLFSEFPVTVTELSLP